MSILHVIFCLNNFVLALTNSTFLFQLSRTNLFEIWRPSLFRRVTTLEVTRGTRAMSSMTMAFCDLEDGRRLLRITVNVIIDLIV